MNREQRRKMNQMGGDLKYLKTPCTITEAAQIARGVAEDVLSEYVNGIRHFNLALSLQVEILKDVVIKAGLITEEEFKEQYMLKAEDFNKEQQKMLEEMQKADQMITEDDTPQMKPEAGDIEVTIAE